jgi:regulator of sigma E protease
MPELSTILQTAYLVTLIVLGLGFLIFIHEAGHFLVAKWKGVRVDAFSLGMGPILWKRLWKGTEYRISAIPLGGYVKMAGENIGDPKTGAPDELTSKPAGARLQIFAAGALMNLVIAFPIAILACLVGRIEGSPVIGSPSWADTEAKIRPGDRILEVDGKPIASTDEYRKLMVALPQGLKVPVTVDRGGEKVRTTVTVQGSSKHGTAPPATTIPQITPGSPADLAGLRDYDEIVKVNGVDPDFEFNALRDQISKAASAGSLTLTVRHLEAGERTLTLTNLKNAPEENWIERDWRLMAPIILEPDKGTSAALAGLKGDDVIEKIDDKVITNFQEIVEAIESRPGQRVKVQVRRGSKGEILTPEILVRFKSQSKGVIGVAPARSPKVILVAEDSPFYKAGLRSGDELVSVEGQPDPATTDIAMGRPWPVKFKIKRDDLQLSLEGGKRTRLDFKHAGFPIQQGVMAFGYNRIERRWTFGGAISSGLKEPVELTDMTFRVLGKLFVGQEDASGMSGPLGIFKASFLHAEMGLGNFLWLLCLITVNLGIFNLLPVPVLDGGHILLLVIEKLKGAPPSARFVERFQLVGLVLLLSLLIFVTVNDLRPGR